MVQGRGKGKKKKKQMYNVIKKETRKQKKRQEWKQKSGRAETKRESQKVCGWRFWFIDKSATIDTRDGRLFWGDRLVAWGACVFCFLVDTPRVEDTENKQGEEERREKKKERKRKIEDDWRELKVKKSGWIQRENQIEKKKKKDAQ